LTDQQALADIAKHAKHDGVGIAAIARLTDQGALADIAKSAQRTNVRVAAICCMTDQNALADIICGRARDCEVWQVRVAAVNRMTDQALLREIANAALQRLPGSGADRRQAAETLVIIAQGKPQLPLLRANWHHLHMVIQDTHTDQSEHIDSRDSGGGHGDHADHYNLHHRDTGGGDFRGLSFPPKPTDF
jgi:hypothetical protein